MDWIETVNTYLPTFKFVTAIVVPFVIPIFVEVFPRRFSADWRCKLWLFAMLSMCVAPFLYRIHVQWPIMAKSSAKAASPLSDGKYESEYARPSGSLPSLEGQPGTEPSRMPVALPANAKPNNAMQSQISPPSNSSRTFSLSNLYSAGVGVLLFRVLYMHWNAYLIRSRSEPIENLGSHSFLQGWSCRNSITLRTSQDIRVPTVVGLIRPAILLPKDTVNWPEEKLMAVVQHESAHIARRDIFWTTAAYVSRAAFWINPLAWIAVGRIMRLRELACDDIASKQALSVYSYAEHLIAIARELSESRDKNYLIASTASVIQQTELKRRLQHILDARQSRVPSSVCSTLVFAVAFGSLAAFCGACPSSITETIVATDDPPKSETTQGAVLFSGYVRDRSGEPIAGAKLSAGYWDQSLTEQDRLASEVSTNEDGYFEWRNPLVFRLYVTKFGYLNQQIDVSGPKERQIVLQDAYKIRGVVLGPNSKPVAGAKVSAFVDADVAQPPRTVLTTDANGKFEYAGASRPKVNLAAFDDDGQAGTLANASNTDNNNNIIQLLPPKNVKLRVTDHAGNPVPDAEVILGSWNKSGVIRFTDKSNSQGEVVWPKAPSGTLVIAARSPGFRTAWAILNTQTSATAEMTLYPPFEFSCTAVDSETGESLNDFIVTRLYERKVSGKLDDEKYPQGSLPEIFRNLGTIGDRTKDGVVTFVSDYAFDKMMLKIHADGYQTLEDNIDSKAEVSPRRNYRLTKMKHDTATEIQVVGPDEKPASNVNVQVQSPGRGGILRSDPDEITVENLQNPGAYLKTNSNGKLFLPADPKIGTITAWGDSGWFFDNLSTFDPGKPLALEPYSRVRIRFPLNMRQNKLARFVLKKNVEVQLKGGPTANSVWIEVNPTNEAIQEEIVVERAMGGTISLVDTSMRPNQRLVNDNVIASFEVEPGSEVLVDLAGTSKISGTLSLPKNANVRLEQLEIRASTRSKDQTKTYRSLVQSDGYFEFNEISAGDYTFSIPSTEIEPKGGMPQPLPLNFAILNLGIDLEESVAEGQTRDLGVVETEILKQR